MMFSATRGYLKTASPRHQPPWVFMVSTYLTRSPKKITTRNTSARKIYTASRWVCLQHSGTNMYQSHWKSSSFPSFEVKKNPQNLNETSTLIVVDFSGLYKTHQFNQLVGCEIYGSFRTSRFCMLSGAKTVVKTGRKTKPRAFALPRRRKSWVHFLPTENPGVGRRNVCRKGVPCKSSQPLK